MLPVQITIKNIPTSPALDTHIRKRAQKLKHFFHPISSCRIVVELPQKHKHQGKLYNVRIDVTVPGKELVATRKSDEDIYVAIREAFKVMERQLEEHGRKRHGRIKTHNDVMYGQVSRLLSTEGYGFIEGYDGNEYYFSMTNVSHPTFEQLTIGDEVEYMPEQQSEGLCANHVVKKKEAIES
ncbi:MAG: ribosomal subunit interface protein [Gammaproteobacteria bacterium RIFCSPHIGHO2_12_FULL_38_11]|nr:MAG: ribosomal subunit interface protein [Gammaproteobacteria bacterium RIFCSPHIGHO2_12_FULL_38_11]